MKTNKSILTPEGMYSFAGKALRPCFILAIIVILAAMYVGFFLAPATPTAFFISTSLAPGWPCCFMW